METKKQEQLAPKKGNPTTLQVARKKPVKPTFMGSAHETENIVR